MTDRTTPPIAPLKRCHKVGFVATHQQAARGQDCRRRTWRRLRKRHSPRLAPVDSLSAGRCLRWRAGERDGGPVTMDLAATIKRRHQGIAADACFRALPAGGPVTIMDLTATIYD